MPTKIDNESLRAYLQHGFIPDESIKSDSQSVGRCPFCNKKDKFYVNKQTKAWDCKSCGRSGGFKTFLEQIGAQCTENFRESTKNAKLLSQRRGIEIETFNRFDVGYNIASGSFCIPVMQPDGSGLTDIRIYHNSRLISTSTCRTGLLNGHLMKDYNTIWLCEGEWDGMIMDQILHQLGIEDELAIAVPGASVLKSEWIPLFTNKKIYCLYDNDMPGKNGTVRAFNSLSPVVSELYFLHWTSDRPDGYDIRDLYKDSGEKAQVVYDAIKSNVRSEPIDTGIVQKQKNVCIPVVYDGDGVDVEQVYEVFERWLHMPNRGMIDALFGSVFANRLSGDPLWMFLIAPPGMTKTTLLQTMTNAKGIKAVSTLTPHALVSGVNLSGGGDPSLINQLDERVLVIKDFTTILNMNQQAREEIFGILRDAYDGEITKIFGNGVTRHYEKKFGIIAGVTPAIETFMETESALGERFLRYEQHAPTTIEGQLEYARRAIENVSREVDMVREMRDVVNKCLNYQHDTIPMVPPEYEEKCLYLSLLVSTARGTVIRDRFTKEVVSRPFVEIGTRLSKQLVKLLIGISMFRRESTPGELEFHTVKHVARSTMSGKTGMFLELLYDKKGGDEFTAQEINRMTRLPLSTIQRQLETMYLLRLIDKNELSALKMSWRISETVIDLIEKSSIFE